MPLSNDELDARLLEAHERYDTDQLVGLYTRAAEMAKEEQMVGFYLTHAYVFALEAGDIRAVALREKLIRLGREE